jgi:hypothetical protein
MHDVEQTLAAEQVLEVEVIGLLIEDELICKGAWRMLHGKNCRMVQYAKAGEALRSQRDRTS